MESRITQLCEEAIQEKLFPGCVVGYFREGRTTVLPYGNMTYNFVSPGITADSVYDVGSITKSVPTSCLVLHLVERGLLSLDDKVITFIPEISNQFRQDILVRHLLTYTVIFDIPGGLPAVAREAPQHILESIFSAGLADRPGTSYSYHNPPAILMGLLVERLTNKPLNEYANDVFGPLNMDRTSFSSGWVGAQSVAPTAIDWRGEVQGAPYDVTAWGLRQAGKIAGHSGLFSTAPDLLIFAQMLLNHGTHETRQYFSPATVKAMYSNQVQGLGESAGLGWELDSKDMTDPKRQKQLFGKNGTTGCMFLIDPKSHRALVHLSNWTYPERRGDITQLTTFRRELTKLVLGGVAGAT